MSDHLDPPIIRIVKKGQGHAHHGGAWKVAFADFVTAMMALFIVLWILGQSEDVKRGIGGYFRDPTGKALLGAGPADAIGSAQGKSIVRLSAIMQRYTMPDAALEGEAQKLEDFVEQSEALAGIKDQISIEVTHEGLRVEINDGANEALFESGSSKLSPKLINAIKVLTAEYQKLPNKIIVEGHTDGTPFADGSGLSNWELSTQRANEARAVMEETGLPKDQVLMVRGFADRRPRFDDPLDPRNRRISMLLVSDQGMDIALGRIGFAGVEDNEITPKNPGDKPTSSRTSLFATGKGEH